VAISPSLKRNLLRAAVAMVAVALAWIGWQGVRLWRAWNGAERLPFDIVAAREALAAQSDFDGSVTSTLPQNAGTGEGTLPGDTARQSSRPAGDALQTFLIIGSDQQPERGLSSRADVIILLMVPPEGAAPVMVSIPRDLYLPNPCTGGSSRVNANLNGCGAEITGPELLTVAVEDFTGVKIDHFALFDFEGFRQIVDRVGGVEICVENAVRDSHTDPLLDLPAGCTLADGAMTLSWVRSRHTQELVNGSWRSMPGVNDLARNQRQQDLLLEALTRLKGFSSITEFAGLVESLADTFAFDEGLSLGEAIDLAWGLRGIDPADINRVDIPVAYFTAPDGALVLIPTAPFLEVLEAAYPGASAIIGHS
jgi:LCP family protein required for cell wall assembly